MAKAVRILLVSWRPLARAAIRAMLSSHDDLDLIAEASDDSEAGRLVRQLRPDVLVLDTGMARAPSLLAGLRVGNHSTGIQPHSVVLVATADELVKDPALAQSVRGCVVEDDAACMLAQVCRSVAQGVVCLSPSVFRGLLAALGPRTIGDGVSALTACEVQMLRLAASGMSDREIGRQLAMAERTVRYRLRGIYDKMGVNTRIEAIVRAVQAGLAPKPDVSPNGTH